MIFQLPNGKIIHLSVEEYLHLTDEDIQFIISTGYGHEPANPFYSSAINKPAKEKNQTIEEYIDYQPESEELDNNSIIDIDSLTDEDLDCL